jgi:hypothetical protein
MGHLQPLKLGRVFATPFGQLPNIRSPGAGRPLRISRPDDLTKIVLYCSVAIGTFDAVDLHWLCSTRGMTSIALCAVNAGDQMRPPERVLGFH